MLNLQIRKRPQIYYYAVFYALLVDLGYIQLGGWGLHFEHYIIFLQYWYAILKKKNHTNIESVYSGPISKFPLLSCFKNKLYSSS